MECLRGHLLIASPQLADPNFCRSVVLMVQHDDGGAFGLVLNRPLDTLVVTAWEQVSEVPCQAEGYLHHGGPCEGPLMVIHTDASMSDMEIVPGLYFSAEKESVQELALIGDGQMRFFVGYAGWKPGQLEAEMEEGAWLAVPASEECVFGEESEQWQMMLKSVAQASPLMWVNPKLIPDDPSVN